MHFWNTHTITTNNLVNGEPIYYWKDRTGGTISSNAGQIIVVNCKDLIIEKCNVEGALRGVVIVDSESIEIESSTISTMEESLFILRSNNNTIKNNIVCSSDDDGIVLSSSNENLIINNSAMNASSSGIALFYSNNNIISNNEVLNNSDSGIKLYKSNNTIIEGNAISENDYRGIEVYFSDNSTIKIIQFHIIPTAFLSMVPPITL